MIDWFARLKAFAPFPPRSIADLKWYHDTFFKLFDMPLGLYAGGLGGAAFLFGAYMMASRVSPSALFLLIAPLLLTLAASAMQKYPFQDRVILFFCPVLATLVAAGIAYVSRADSSMRVLAMILTAVLLLYPTYMAVKSVASGPYLNHDIKPSLEYVADHWQEGDVIYVHYGAEWLYKYYVDVLNYKDLRRKPIVVGIFPGWDRSVEADLVSYGKDVDRAEGRKRCRSFSGCRHNNTRRCSSFSWIVAAPGSTSSKARNRPFFCTI